MSFMENNAYLHSIRIQLEGGDAHGAMQGMIDLLGDLCSQVQKLEYQVQALYEHLDPDADFDLFSGEYGSEDDDSEYIMECSNCGCMLEIESELLEDDAILSCPECGAVLSLF